MSEELRGDLPSDLAANAPIRSALSFFTEFKRVVWRVLDGEHSESLVIYQAPAIVPN